MTGPSAPTQDQLKRFEAWVQRHRRPLITAAAAVAVGAGGVWFWASAKERRERFARNALESAQIAVQSGNLPLAASDLSRMIEAYGGTQAAGEGVILLAQIRLTEEDATTAAQELRRALDRGIGNQYRAAAHHLLGVALENMGNATDAAESYLSAARAAWYPYLSAEYLLDAGRAFAAAGDTGRAVQTYQEVLERHGDSPSAGEARVRLAELTALQNVVGG